MQDNSRVKELIEEMENYEIFVKYLKDYKGYDYTVEQCYEMVQYFKDSENICDLNPTQDVLFIYGNKEAKFFIGTNTQCNRIFELYHALKYGLSPARNLNKQTNN